MIRQFKQEAAKINSNETLQNHLDNGTHLTWY